MNIDQIFGSVVKYKNMLGFSNLIAINFTGSQVLMIFPYFLFLTNSCSCKKMHPFTETDISKEVVT